MLCGVYVYCYGMLVPCGHLPFLH